MKILAVVASVYYVSLTIYCTRAVIGYYKECGFDLGGISFVGNTYNMYWWVHIFCFKLKGAIR